MTFNIWNYNRPWPVRRRLIADIIAAHQPDVIALQETRHDWRFERGKGQGEQLAELTGYHPTSAVGQVYVPILRVDEGLTILTRSEPQRTYLHSLTIYPRDREDENQRICLGVGLEIAGTAVDVYDTHFSLSASARLSNAVEVARFIRETSEERPAVVMGDLNAEPDTPPIRFLLGREEVEGQTGDFADCWVLANPGQPGYTYGSFDPVRRIDYVLARNLPIGVSAASIVGAEAVNGVYPSDHMGIVVDIRL
jgi:endonuclease/exonuclease/phosphatase family metal-dependent hydrolase